MKNIILTLSIFLFATSYHAQWLQKGADIDGEAAADFSGYSVAMSSNGNTLAIGAPYSDETGINSGQVRVYQWNGTAWTQQGADINGEAVGDRSGFSVSMNAIGNIVAIGAYGNDGNGLSSGHVRLYQWNGTTWAQMGADIDGEAANDNSGFSVSLSSDGHTVAIGAYGNDASFTSAGHTRIYTWNGSTWTQKGDDIDGVAPVNLSGYSVSMSSDGNSVAIGATNNNNVNGNNAGLVRVYFWSGTAWVQKGFDINGEGAGDFSGSSVSLSADGITVAIGAFRNSGTGVDAGHVRVYSWSGTAWIQKGADIDGEASGDESGTVAINANGTRLVVGAKMNAGSGLDAGHARVFEWNGTAWVQVGMDLDGEAAGDESGLSVAISADGSSVAIGATKNYGAGIDAGHVRVYHMCITNSSTDTQTACDSYTWIDGNTYLTNNTTATHVLTNAGGCDSIVTLDLTIHTLDSSVTQVGATLTANVSGATYQWLDCDNNYSAINSATSQSFVATSNGNFAVQITQNGCTDTSACNTIAGLGILENTFENNLILHPNPTEGNLTVDMGQNHESVQVKITDLNGKLIQSLAFKNSQLLHLKIEEPAGVYLLTIQSSQEKATIRLVKK